MTLIPVYVITLFFPFLEICIMRDYSALSRVFASRFSIGCSLGGAENARLENAGLELSAPNCRGGKCKTGNIGTILQGVENAGLELSAPNCRGGKCRTGNIGAMLQGVENAGLELSGTGNVWNATCSIT